MESNLEMAEMIKRKAPNIIILSDGTGASGTQVVNSVLAQFSDSEVVVRTTGHVRTPEKVEKVLRAAIDEGALIVHTLVDPALRQYMVQSASALQITHIDIMGPLLEWTEQQMGRPPLGTPGLFRQLHQDYFERVAAIDYALYHDDGKNPEGWPDADLVIVGVSRAGKTPLSIFLSVLGHKVANVPWVPEIGINPIIYSLEPGRVVAIHIAVGQLIQHRLQRLGRLGAGSQGDYADPELVFQEVEAANEAYRKYGWKVMDVTDRPIESSADEMVKYLSRRF